ncbi:MAG TPA: DinB family protein [Gemmatimonadales bacterium]|nr:DinB family protein [Gemmatimonadales bacterium]
MPFDLTNAAAVLERTPLVLRELLSGLSTPWLHATEGHDTWSPVEIVAHLIGAEESDWVVRARTILAQGPDRRFEPFDRVGAINALNGRSIDELLARFSELRARNLAELIGWSLTLDQLQLTGEHPAFGRVTLEQLLATWVVHDLGHIAQVARVMAKQYRAEVGPWQAYLSILTR